MAWLSSLWGRRHPFFLLSYFQPPSTGVGFFLWEPRPLLLFRRQRLRDRLSAYFSLLRFLPRFDDVELRPRHGKPCLVCPDPDRRLRRPWQPTAGMTDERRWIYPEGVSLRSRAVCFLLWEELCGHCRTPLCYRTHETRSYQVWIDRRGLDFVNSVTVVVPAFRPLSLYHDCILDEQYEAEIYHVLFGMRTTGVFLRKKA